MTETAITVRLPARAVEQLERAAREQHRSVPDMVRDMVLQDLPRLPALPPDVEAELSAFSGLSDDVLLLLARSTLTEEQQSELAELNQQAQRRSLSESERIRQQELGDAYDRMLVRRAEAAAVLKSRGHDLSDLSLLQAG